MMHYIRYLFSYFVLNLLFLVPTLAQDMLSIIVVNDEKGNPVSGAMVTVGEGAVPLITNENGELRIYPVEENYILVEAEGFESILISASIVLQTNTIILKTPVFHMGEKDQVNIPFGKTGKRQLSGATTTLNIQEIISYDHQSDINTILRGRTPGMFGNKLMRGINDDMLVLVDGIPRPADLLNLEQIEEITVIKDLSTAMFYGSQAANGLILITTRRGKPLKKELRFTAQYGLITPISYPKYLPAGDYMELYNEALNNDDLPLKFSEQDITRTKNRLDPVRYPDESYYNSTYLKDYSSSMDFVGEASGGNEVANYYLNLGLRSENSLLRLGEGGNERSNRFNMRGNIDYQVVEHIKFRFDGMVVFNLSRTPRYTDLDFWNMSTVLHPHIYPVLIPSEITGNEEILGAAKLVNGSYLLGGTPEYQYNIYGELTKNGYTNVNNRLFHLSSGLDFDLNALLPGLTASANISMDMFNMFRADLRNSYAVYQLFHNEDTLSSISVYGLDLRRDEQDIVDEDFNRRNVSFGTLDYNRTFNNIHKLQVSALTYADVFHQNGVTQYNKNLHFGLRGNYMYRNKFIADFTGTLAGSGRLLNSIPFALSPGLGFGWVLTEENFLKDMPIIDYLKIRANWALIHTDERIGYYRYNNWYGSGSNFQYGQGTYSNSARIFNQGNPDLRWEKVMNTSIGFESFLFDHRLGIEGGFFRYKSFDLISQTFNSLPAYYTANMYRNFESNQVQGCELGLHHSENFGPFKVQFGSNLTYAVPKALKVDEIDYSENYLKRQGKMSDAIFGWVDLGLFENQDDIDRHEVQTFGEVKPGDIKYKDMNGDGVIDDLDRMIIGNSNPRLAYGLNMLITYRAFELFALGYGQAGQHVIFDDPYYWVSGERKYSEVVWNRWTPQTASEAVYPRLSTLSGDNNFRESTFWVEKNDWFRLQTVQLTFTMDEIKLTGIDEMRLFLRGMNIFHISKIADKTTMNIGSPPQTRTFALGIKAMF